ncbi:MAG: UDP-N-acetylmuramate--alanine ligase [Eubacteriales bacterium]|nr:UDP-N-acetylmuramate--alanine ligase [Eubacteriales bacterium]MDN5363030.1 UDP-N-acetylmuramate--alanine ligase [Eubacteriales bacterium]
MSGLARLLLELGWQVSGSDLKPSATTERLISMGARVEIGHRAENLPDVAELVVVSSAIPEDNVEYQEARRRGMKIVRRGELLAMLFNERRGVAVAGSHGKTTTTAMIALVLERGGLDPTVAVGAEINGLGTNARLGKGPYMVAEADESDGSFLLLRPEIAVITNIEADHLDYYRDFARIEEAFHRFGEGIKEGGLAVLGIDSEPVAQMGRQLSRRYISYGFRPDAQLRAVDCVGEGMVTRGRVLYQNRSLGMLELRVPGLHNMANALAAVAVGLEWGIPFAQIASALGEFRGTSRRFQFTGEIDGVSVYDDYAHHPTEIKATLKAARQRGAQRIIAVFQPHRYTRTAFLYREFATAFGDADVVVLSDIYSAGEPPQPGVNTGLILNAMREAEKDKEIYYFPSQEEIVNFLAGYVREGDLVLTMGAGDIWKAGRELISLLRERQRTG